MSKTLLQTLQSPSGNWSLYWIDYGRLCGYQAENKALQQKTTIESDKNRIYQAIRDSSRKYKQNRIQE